MSMIFIASRRPVCGAPGFRGSKICCSLSVGHFVGPGYSAAIDNSNSPPLTVVGATDTVMVLRFLRTVIHCCTTSALAPDAATYAMLRHWCVEDGVSVRGGRDGRDACCDVGLPIVCCLRVCLWLPLLRLPSPRSIERGLSLLGESMLDGTAFPATVL